MTLVAQSGGQKMAENVSKQSICWIYECVGYGM